MSNWDLIQHCNCLECRYYPNCTEFKVVGVDPKIGCLFGEKRYE